MPRRSSGVEHRADVLVVVDHHVVVCALPAAGLADALGLGVGPEVHVGEVHPDEERLVGLRLPLDEVDGAGGDVVVDRLHPLLGQRAGVLDRLLADLAESRVDRRVVDVGGLAVEHAPRAVLLPESRVLGIVAKLRLLLGVEVVEVAVELVEAVDRGQELVAVAQVVLAELAGRVAVRLEQLGDRGVLLLKAQRRARQADLGQAGAQPCCPVMNDARPAVQLCSA